MRNFSWLLFFAIVAMGAVTYASQQQNEKRIELKQWKFQTGNNPEWADPQFNDSGWPSIKVPANWEPHGYADYNGYAWYRTKVVIPSSLKNKTLAGIFIHLGAVDDRDSTFLNGKLIGSIDRWDEDRNYFIPFNNPSIRWDKENIIAVKVFDGNGPGGIYKSLPSIESAYFIDFVKIGMNSGKFSKTGSHSEIILSSVMKKTVSGKIEIEVISNETGDVLQKQNVHAGVSKNHPLVYNIKTKDGISCRVLCKFTDDLSGKSIEFDQGLQYILTPKTPEQPHFNGPKVYGVRPGSPVIFHIPVTGNKPMKLTVSDLPDGLRFNSEKCILSGSIVKAGEYKVNLSAKNEKGSDKRELKFVVGNQLALTPPMGWNSWNCWGLSVDDRKIRAAADAFIKDGLADYGWTYINIDDGWEAPKRGKSGEILANEKFPDMKKLTGYVHSLGLKIGLYSSPGDYTCGGYLGSLNHEAQDAAVWSDWGFDYIKYDWCSYSSVKPKPTLDEMKAPYKSFGEILSRQPRDIVFSLCQYGMGDVWKWGGEVGGNLWRTTGDINDSWGSMSEIGFSQFDKSANARPGNWNDPDMLVVGQLGWGNVRPTYLTPDEQYTHISLWSLLASPLLIGCDLEQMDDFTKGLLCNSEVIDINQDPLGKQAERISNENQLQICAKPLEDGSIAVGMFNLSDKYMKGAALSWSALNIRGSYNVRDVWRQLNTGKSDDRFNVNIPAHGAVLLKLTKLN